VNKSSSVRVLLNHPVSSIDDIDVARPINTLSGRRIETSYGEGEAVVGVAEHLHDAVARAGAQVRNEEVRHEWVGAGL
jgi:hypothetical protein